MRNNQPVTQKQISIPADAILVSRTDLTGNIVVVNADFAAVCGYSIEEILGQPYNIIRHPDVPSQVFEDLWDTIQNGYSWNAIVKNRAKNGDYYWVNSNMSPIVKNGRVVGYASVGIPASQEEIALATQAYADIAAGKSRMQRALLVDVAPQSRQYFNPAYWLRNQSVSVKPTALQLLLMAVMFFLGGVLAFDQWDRYQVYDDALDDMTHAIHISDVVHELQVERGLTASYQANRNDERWQAVQAQRLKSDERLALLHNAELTQSVQSLRARAAEKTPLAPIYTELIAGALAEISQMVPLILEQIGDRADPFRTYDAMNRYKEQKGIERATIKVALLNGMLTPEQLMQIYALIGKQESLIYEVKNSAPSQVWAEFDAMLSSSEQQQVNALREQLLEMFQGKSASMDANTWFNLSTSLIVKVNDINNRLGQLFVQQLAEYKSGALLASVLSAVLAFLGLVFLLWISLSAISNLRRN